MKIMIVDDSKMARLFTRKCVEMVMPDAEIEFIDACDGEDAFKQLEKMPVDLILCDVNMPVMTGFTFIRNIKTNAPLASIPVVFITSMANTARTDNLIQLGAVEVILKPVKPQKIKSVLEKIGIIGNKADSDSDDWGA